MMIIVGDKFDLVREQVSVTHCLMITTGVEAQAGGRFTCPSCGSGSAQITKSNRSWTCWSGECHKRHDDRSGADAVGLASIAWQCSRVDAATRLLDGDTSQRAIYRPIPQKRHHDEAGHVSDTSEWQTWVTDIVERSQRELADPNSDVGRQARHHLCQVRGLTPDTCKAYGLGVNPEWTGITINGDRCVAAPGITIPWTRPNGFSGLNVRQLHTPLKAKYVMATGSRRTHMWPGPLVKWDHAWSYRGPILIVEGELDTVLAQQHLAGLILVKTAGGASSSHAALDHDERRQLSYHADILVCTDSDAAGDACFESWREWGPTVRRITLPQGFKDVGEAVQAGVDLRGWLVREMGESNISLRRDAGDDEFESDKGADDDEQND